jgi:hypothetical protein
MVHPSTNDPDDQEVFPPGVTEEHVEKLLEAVKEALTGIGLYMSPAAAIERRGDHLFVTANLEVGQIAFSKGVQDPEQAQFDDQFRSLEQADAYCEADEILSEFSRDDTSQTSETEEP